VSIVLKDLTKIFGKHRVVDRVSLEVEPGELFVLLGESGSGKSTILRLIAGLWRADGGTILLHGQDVTATPPQSRGVGFVFQNYSVFRHMSVAENVEFGLRVRRRPRAERRQRREELLDLLGLGGLGHRYANQLSGGQQQRVALARALAYEPQILLLDEPFGALDIKIRAQLRRGLREIQRKLGVATVLVTHDQVEAFELGDRIGVIERGRLLEVGRPEDLYDRPRSLAVATFVGSGTVLVGRSHGDVARFGDVELPIPADVPHESGARVRVLFRPEDVSLSESPPAGADRTPVLGRGEVFEQSFGGATKRLRLRLPPLREVRQIAPPLPYGEEGLIVEADVSAEERTPQLPWVVLKGWHILRRPAPRLLACDPGDGTTDVLEMADHLADAVEGAVTLLAVAPDRTQTSKLEGPLTARRDEVGLHRAAVRVRAGDPLEQVLAEQAEGVHDFILVGFREGEGRRAGRGDSTAVRLLDYLPVPVLLVRGPVRRPRKILICTAVGEPGKADIRIGGWVARQLAAEATLLHVYRGAEPPQWVRDHLRRGVATLRSLEVAASLTLRPAETPAEGIRDEARDGDYDLVVVGGHPPELRGERENVTRQVVDLAGCSVLVVPEGA
jgi:ABC-type Fe3+/spermidine/putrescine transport system ATPase subunit/nucleotide-binding universal stress UspA family protein